MPTPLAPLVPLIRQWAQDPAAFMAAHPQPVLLRLPPALLLPLHPPLAPAMAAHVQAPAVASRLKALAGSLDPGQSGVLFVPRQGVVGDGSAPAERAVPQAGLAPRHARFGTGPQGPTVMDLESGPGSWLEGRRLSPGIPVPLIGGAVLRLGEFEGMFLTAAQFGELVAGWARALPAGLGALATGVRAPGPSEHDPTRKLARPVPASRGQTWREFVADVRGLPHAEFLARYRQPFLYQAPFAQASGSSGERVHSLTDWERVGRLVLGRSPARCQILLEGLRSLSARHVELRALDRSRWAIRDLESSNGTFLEGERLPAGVLTPLRAGATIGLSVARLRYVTSEQLARLLVRQGLLQAPPASVPVAAAAAPRAIDLGQQPLGQGGLGGRRCA